MEKFYRVDTESKRGIRNLGIIEKKMTNIENVSVDYITITKHLCRIREFEAAGTGRQKIVDIRTFQYKLNSSLS